MQLLHLTQSRRAVTGTAFYKSALPQLSPSRIPIFKGDKPPALHSLHFRQKRLKNGQTLRLTQSLCVRQVLSMRSLTPARAQCINPQELSRPSTCPLLKSSSHLTEVQFLKHQAPMLRMKQFTAVSTSRYAKQEKCGQQNQQAVHSILPTGMLSTSGTREQQNAKLQTNHKTTFHTLNLVVY